MAVGAIEDVAEVAEVAAVVDDAAVAAVVDVVIANANIMGKLLMKMEITLEPKV